MGGENVSLMVLGEVQRSRFNVLPALSLVPLRSIRPDVPQALEAAILCCLEKDMTQRFQSVSELARAIAPFGPETSRMSAERIERVLPSLRTPGDERLSIAKNGAASTVTVIVGVAGIGAGATLFVWSGSKSKPAAAIGPLVLPGGAGLGARGRF